MAALAEMDCKSCILDSWNHVEYLFQSGNKLENAECKEVST